MRSSPPLKIKARNIFTYHGSHRNNACIPTSDDVLVVIVPAEVSQVPVVCSPGRGHSRHAAVGVEVDVLDFGVLRHRAQSLLFHVELDLRHLGDPKKTTHRVKFLFTLHIHMKKENILCCTLRSTFDPFESVPVAMRLPRD